MANPPAVVKLALESICLLLNEGDTTDWKIIRSILNKDSFIPSIVNFDTLSLTYENFLLLHSLSPLLRYHSIFGFYLSFPIFTLCSCLKCSHHCPPPQNKSCASLNNQHMLWIYDFFIRVIYVV